MKNKTLQDRLLQYLAFLGISDREFARRAGLASSHMTAIKNGTTPGFKVLHKILSAFPDLNSDWLVTGTGEMIGKKSEILQETEVNYVVSSREQISIPIADIKAAAGGGYMNDVLRTSEFIQLPPNLTKSGKYLCIRIKGNSMSPTLQDGGFVIIRLLDRGDWKHLLSDRVYVVSDNEGKTYLKRVRNRFNNGFIVLTSDNPDKATYPNFNLQMDEIISIWYVEWYLSAKMPNIHDQFYSRLERLENSIEDINRKFEDIERIELKNKKP